MAYNLEPGIFYELTVFTQDDEQLGVNVLHYVTGTTTGAFPSTTFASALSDRLAAPYKGWLADGAKYLGIKVRPLTAIGGVLQGPDYSSNGADFGSTGPNIPRQLAGLISKRIAGQGPRARGRIYIPFPGEDELDGRAVSAAGIADLDTIAQALLGVTAGGFTLSGGVGVSVVLTPQLKIHGIISGNPLSKYIVHDQFATQRRRGFYGRPNSAPAELA